MSENPIRILHVLGGLERGGAETFVMNLYRSIDRSKMQFDFVIHTEERGAFYSEILSLGGRVFSSPQYTGKNHFLYKKWWRDFLSQHKEYQVIHSHVRSTATIYLKLAKNLGRKTIIHSHSTSNGSGIGAVVKAIMQYPLRYTADYLFACSLESGKWLFGNKAVQRDNFYEIKNAIDLTKCAFNSSIREEYRKSLGLEDKTIYIHVGRLHPAKNHDFLIDLFKDIVKANRKAHFLLVGDGELRRAVEKKICDLEIQDFVTMLGSRSDVGSLLQAADCFLFPSLWEGVPLTVIEAQAAGLPCLVSDKVTDDVVVSELVTKLPIDKGIEIWTEKVLLVDCTRKDVISKIASAGYDAATLAKWMEKKYYSFNKE